LTRRLGRIRVPQQFRGFFGDPFSLVGVPESIQVRQVVSDGVGGLEIVNFDTSTGFFPFESEDIQNLIDRAVPGSATRAALEAQIAGLLANPIPQEASLLPTP